MVDTTDILQDEYRLRFSETERYRADVWKVLCDKYFSRFFTPDSSVLDLGSGWGEFINNIQAKKKYAMDLNPEAGCKVSDKVQFSHQDCSKEWGIETESLDVIFTSNFLEHLPDKAHIERTITEAHRCLKHDGQIICLGPNIKHVPGAYWDFWDHFVPLTDNSLSELLMLKGFIIQSKTSRFLPYSMSNAKRPPLFFVKLYLKLPFIWPLFGKQFLIVGRKE